MLVVYDADPDLESSVLEVAVKQLLAKVREQEELLYKNRAEAFSLTSKFDQRPDCAELNKQIQELNALISKIENPRGPVSEENDKPKQPETDNPQNPDAGEMAKRDRGMGKSKAVKAEVKRLYRKLAKICHPDKTNDKHLVPLFTIVQDAYTNWDLRALIQLDRSIQAYLDVKKSNRKRKSLLRQNLETARRSLLAIKQALLAQKSELGGSLVEMHKTEGEERAVAMYKDAMGQHLLALKLKLRRLTSPPVITVTSLFSYSGSTSTSSGSW